MMKINKILSLIFCLFVFIFAFSFNDIKALSDEVEFVKVTTSGSVEDGKYLIVYEDGDKAYVFNSTLSTLDSTKNYVQAVIVDEKITISEDYAFTIQGTNIISTSGKYIYRSSTSNGLNTSDTEVGSNTISVNASAYVNISSSNTSLKFNAAKDQLRFRYYASGQSAICLYKLGGATADIEKEAWEKFEELDTKASLNLEYLKVGNSEEFNATMKYTSSATTNMVEGNNASKLGLDADKFNVTSNENSSNLTIGLNKSGEIRVYAENIMTVTSLTGKIESIQVTYKSSALKVYVDDKEIVGTKNNNVYSYSLNSTEKFIIKNTSGSQLAIYQIVLNCIGGTVEYENISAQIRFGACIEKELYDQLAEYNPTFGVAIISSSKLNGKELNENTNGVILKNISPAQVTSQFGNEESAEGAYYQFALVLKNLEEENYNIKFSARAYVLIEDKYYFMSLCEYSIKSLSQEYVEKYINDEIIKNHIGVLKVLAK